MVFSFFSVCVLAPPVVSTVPRFALLPYSRTIGDPVDSPFQCIGMSNTFWQPVQASWVLGSPSSGSRITNGTFGVLSAQDTLTLSGNYEGGTIIYTCLVTSLSDNRVNSRTRSSPVSIDVYCKLNQTYVSNSGEAWRRICATFLQDNHESHNT